MYGLQASDHQGQDNPWPQHACLCHGRCAASPPPIAAAAAAASRPKNMDVLRSVAPAGSPLSVGSPLVWFIFGACALLQLPLLMDICSQLFGVNRLVHNAVSKVLVALMTTCGCLSTWMFHTIFLPRWQQATRTPLLPLTIFTTWLFLNASYRLSCTNASTPTAT